ncbi:MAG TPA: prolyl oligopeptidase family serine peptidase [Chitinophagaceae bacterium]|nr:prolyl oligopeptidase family serine peptidase [Chitinophagaceae bacterium]
MKKIYLLMLTASLAAFNARAQYPKPYQSDQVDTYFGKKINDPYRWMENENSDTLKAWIAEENVLTEKFLSGIPYRNDVRKKLEEMFNYPKYGAPSKQGAYYIFSKNSGLQNQSVLYRQKGLAGSPELLLDPNTLSADGTVALGGVSFPTSGKYMGYTISRSGSDWQEAHIMNVADGKLLQDHLVDLKFTGLDWKGEEGFYYSRYPKPDESKKLTNQNEHMKVYFHKLGDKQENDQLIYEDPVHPKRFFNSGITEDERFLVIASSEGTSGQEILYKDLKDASQTAFKVLLPGFANEHAFVDNSGDKLLVKTNLGAPNFRVVLIDPKDPGTSSWKNIIPEQKEVLLAVSTAGGYLFAQYLKDAYSLVKQFDYSGKLIRIITLPGIGAASGFSGKKNDNELFYTYTSFNYPPTIFKYDIKTGKSEEFRRPEVKFEPSAFEVKQVFFTSKDGAKVPMFLTYKKGLQLDGKNPVLLYGYGGFNVPQTPVFSISNVFFLEQGGIFAMVNLRGGNEYGEEWHKAGMLMNKQNVFNDMIGAAEWLVSNKYSNPSKLAVRGGSNGGLLVGAVVNQRPDLFAVAIPQVGVMDMLRYHRFTIGYAWATEYGNADNSEAEFKNLLSYSPLHNIRQGTCYPATLVTTADHDDRVVPAHSFKYTAALQAAQGCDKPTLIRIETKAGHGAGKPISKILDEAADIWSFIMYNMGMSYK